MHSAQLGHVCVSASAISVRLPAGSGSHVYRLAGDLYRFWRLLHGRPTSVLDWQTVQRSPVTHAGLLLLALEAGRFVLFSPVESLRDSVVNIDFLPPSRPAGGGNELHALVLSTISVAASGGVSWYGIIIAGVELMIRSAPLRRTYYPALPFTHRSLPFALSSTFKAHRFIRCWSDVWFDIRSFAVKADATHPASQILVHTRLVLSIASHSNSVSLNNYI